MVFEKDSEVVDKWVANKVDKKVVYWAVTLGLVKAEKMEVQSVDLTAQAKVVL